VSGSFALAFSEAFDIVGAHVGMPPVHAFISDRPPTATDPGVIGDLWIDPSVYPIPTWVFYQLDPHNPPGWNLAAEFRVAVGFESSHRLWEACLLLALRNYLVMNAPLGLAGGYDIGAVYVGRIDADYNRLIKGFRARGVPVNQEWPTLDDVRARLQMSTGVASDVDLQRALNAAVEQVMEDTAASFGVGG